jgi:hypothetical protein
VTASRSTVVAAVCVLALAVTAWSLNGAWDTRRNAVRAEQRVHARLLDEQASLAAARARVHTARLDGRQATAERDGASLSVDMRQAQLGATNAERDQVASLRDSKTAEVGIVQQCLGGAHLALDALQRGDNGGTVAALRAVDAACRGAQAAQSGPAPNYGFDFPDPAVLPVGGDRFAFATNATAGTIQALHQAAGGGWTTVGDALAQLPAWAARGHTWAPAVLPIGGRYVLYYTVRDARTNRQCISRAVATAPAGPYADLSDGPLVCGDREAIDPEAVVGPDGVPVLLWKRERPASIRAQPLTPDGLALTGTEHELLRADRAWEGSNVEAPSMLVTGSGAWLFFSANSWSTPKYATGVVHCAGPLGPCDHAAAGPVLASHDSLVGPGGASVFVDGFGRWGLAYHAYVAPNVGYPASRLFFTAHLDLTSGSPVVVG